MISGPNGIYNFRFEPRKSTQSIVSHLRRKTSSVFFQFNANLKIITENIYVEKKKKLILKDSLSKAASIRANVFQLYRKIKF